MLQSCSTCPSPMAQPVSLWDTAGELQQGQQQLILSTESCPPAPAPLHIHIFAISLVLEQRDVTVPCPGALSGSQRGCRHISRHTDVHVDIITQNSRHTSGKCSDGGSIQVLVQQNLVQLKMVISSPEKKKREKRKARASATPMHPNGSELHLSR